ncbi:ribonuclease III domain-containing protein [Coniella lustricola]|uniref:Ribonuclease III domain-containing protein n=1 Tax=Coniella lustricola TaxID=2025994 RepID=A0A2T3ABK4_9PEZI|nr:ribonuclease III domain-containing protein [Coniella lustricola]
MSKRPHDGDGHEPITKRSKPADTLGHLAANADELIECMQMLKAQGNGANTALKQRLSKLSQKILPSITDLAHEEEDREESLESLRPEVPVLTAWTPSEVARQLPPVPPILNSAIERASFTHAGMVADKDDQSYEQLEWLGDAYLYLIATAFIFLTFPRLKHGDMCQMREVLVRNATLKEYSVHYGFDKRAIFPTEYGLGGRQGGSKASSKERAKALGDIFEAHVAAIILSDPIQGVAKTTSWLKRLWSTTIAEQIRKQKWQGKQTQSLVIPTMASSSVEPTAQPQKSQRGSAKDALSAELVLQEPRVQIEYRSMDEGRPQKRDPLTKLKLFTQGAFLIGYGETVQLGIGVAKKKTEANERAAENALENKRLINVYREKKQHIMESRRIAQEGASKGLDF